MNTLQVQWDLFAKLVVPKDAPPVQAQEMRRSFYAGAEALMRIQEIIAQPGISEEAAFQILSGCNDELIRFAKEIAKGTA